ncbi:MAG: leucine-rich repeat domain-containing protein [Clostridia bacterium]|nr:leucine-rich repeat domain-containing protein [Clostridia bacterium]
MKKLSLFFLSLIIVFSGVIGLFACNNTPPSESVIPETSNLGYTFDQMEDGYVLTSLNGATEREIGVPAMHQGKPVVKIASGVFTADCGVTKVQIPTTVKNIESGAFDSCESLEKIAVLSGNQNFSAKSGILYNAQGTEFIAVPKAIKGTITLPQTLKAIPERQFANRDGITEVVFPAGFERIEHYAFYMCTSLAKADWPTSIIKVGHGAFYGCKKMTTLLIPGGIEYLGGYCFYGCTLLKLTYDGTQTKWYEMLEVAYADSDLTTEEQEKMYWITWDRHVPTFLVEE